MDIALLSETLEALSDPHTAQQVRRQVRTLRGVRGVPAGEIARVASAAWVEVSPRLPQDGPALGQLFGTAWEDGLVAIGLLAACVPDAPGAARQIALDWAERVDDLPTADALGWLVLGGAWAAGAGGPEGLAAHARPEVRRAAAMAALALTPEPIEGPAAAPLRARLGTRHARWVDRSMSDPLASTATQLVHDAAPPVRKALRRVLRSWSNDAPERVVEWGDSVRGGLPRLVRAEVERARRRVQRGDAP